MFGQFDQLEYEIPHIQTQLGSLSYFTGPTLKTLTVFTPIPLDVSMNFRPHKNKRNIVKYFIFTLKILCKYQVV